MSKKSRRMTTYAKRKRKKTVRKILVIAAIIVLLAGVGFFGSRYILPKMKAPASVNVEMQENGFALSWSAVDGAEGYTVSKKVNGSEESVFRTVAPGETECEDKTVVNGDSVVYYVKANSIFRDGMKAKTESAVYLSPLVFKSISNTDDGVLLKWEKNESAEGYNIYRRIKDTNDPGLKIKKIKKNSVSEYTDTDAIGYDECEYYITSYSGSSESLFSNVLSNIYISEPKNFTARNSPKGVCLSWRTSGAASYNIYRRGFNSDKWKKVGTQKGNQTIFIDDTVKYGKKYAYAVTGIGKTGSESPKSNEGALWAVDPDKKMVALTYDDGPYEPVTVRLLDLMKKYNGRCTFFVVGSRLNWYPDTLRREAAQDCEIGIHTFNHIALTNLKKKEIRKEVNDTADLIKKITGYEAKSVRAPGGAVNDKVKSTVKYPLYNWSVDTLDWKTRDSKQTIRNVKKYVQDGSIVLMHDLYESTADASVKIIPWLVKNGYQLVTVTEMMDAKGINATKGNLYFHG